MHQEAGLLPDCHGGRNDEQSGQHLNVHDHEFLSSLFSVFVMLELKMCIKTAGRKHD